VFGPLDMLNALYALPSTTSDIKPNLSVIATTLEPVSTSSNPDASFAERIQPTHTFDTAPHLDVLIIPGGLGTRSLDLTGDVIKFVKERYKSGKVKFVITVCTGSWLAAKAGILDGKRATSNKASWDGAVQLGNGVHWIAKARWVRDDNIWTTSGVSAGIDGTLAFIAEVYGKEVAETLARNAEYEWHRDASWDPWADYYGLTDATSNSS